MHRERAGIDQGRILLLGLEAEKAAFTERLLQRQPAWPAVTPRRRSLPQVALRRRAGIRADSKLEILAAEHDMYVARIGNVMIKMGPRYDIGDLAPSKEEWRKVQTGQDYAVWEKIEASETA